MRKPALILGLISLGLFAIGCSRNTLAEKKRSSACNVPVVENGVVPNAKPIKVIRNPRAGYNRCYTESGMATLAQDAACDSGYAYVSLVNIRKPGIWNGPCYQADLEFYATAKDAYASETEVLHYDSISVLGLQIYGRLNGGQVMRGPQAHNGLISDKGDTATTSKTAFYLGARYFFLPYLGVELESGGAFGSAVAPNTKSLKLKNAWSTNIGLSLIPFQTMTLAGRLQIIASGGLNYTRLAFTQDFGDFVLNHSGLILSDKAASGFGWYGGGGLRMISRLGFLGDIGVRWVEEYPKFSAGSKAFSGKNLMFDMDVGYQF